MLDWGDRFRPLLKGLIKRLVPMHGPLETSPIELDSTAVVGVPMHVFVLVIYVILANVVLRNAAGVAQVPFLNNFVGWTESYTLLVNGQVRMALDNQRQQAISGLANAASGDI